jgi:hypothetical protein
MSMLYPLFHEQLILIESVLFTVLVGGLKIQMENNTFKCPKDGCGKNFRKENLLQVSNITIQLNINSIYTVVLHISYYGDILTCITSSSYFFILKLHCTPVSFV